MTSNDLKTAALCWLRFGKRTEYVATEVGNYSADVFATTATTSYEIETKISIPDLRNDFKKNKHSFYNHKSSNYGYWVPNYFYFCVPEKLVEEATRLVALHNPKYGILCYTDGLPTIRQMHERLRVVKRAGKIHSQPPKPQILRIIALRMGSDLCNLYLHRHLQTDMWQTLLEQSKAMAGTIALDAEMSDSETVTRIEEIDISKLT